MIYSLQSLRGIFAICVMLSHLSYLGTNDRVFYPGGASGVVYFLILSGFVMCATYADKINSANFSYRNYITKRALRIVPLNWVSLLAAIVLVYGIIELPKLAIVLNFFSLQAWVPDEELYYGFNVPSWTLGPILLFYLLFPYFYRQLKSNIKSFVAWFAVGVTCLMVFYCFLPDDTPTTTWIVRLLPPVRLVEFIIGMLIFEMYVLVANSGLEKKLLSLSYAQKTLIETGLVVVWLLFLWLFHHVGERWTSSVIWWIPTAIVIMGFALLERNGGLFSQLLHFRPLVYLGEISFCIYLTHTLTTKFIGRIYHILHAEPTAAAYLILNIVGSIFVGIIVFELFDKPVNRYLRKRLIPANSKVS